MQHHHANKSQRCSNCFWSLASITRPLSWSNNISYNAQAILWIFYKLQWRDVVGSPRWQGALGASAFAFRTIGSIPNGNSWSFYQRFRNRFHRSLLFRAGWTADHGSDIISVSNSTQTPWYSNTEATASIRVTDHYEPNRANISEFHRSLEPNVTITHSWFQPGSHPTTTTHPSCCDREWCVSFIQRGAFLSPGVDR